jgi:hypothetical protein
MKILAFAALALVGLSAPASAKEPSAQARLLLYCTAAFGVAQSQAQSTGDAAGVKAMQESMGIMGAKGQKLLNEEGVSEAEIVSLSKASVDQALGEFSNNKPRSYSHEQCVEASRK